MPRHSKGYTKVHKTYVLQKLMAFKQVINIFINKYYCFFKNTFIFDLPE
jgi:hypothetical protein